MHVWKYHNDSTNIKLLILIIAHKHAHVHIWKEGNSSISSFYTQCLDLYYSTCLYVY